MSESKSFETAIGELEEIVHRLEEGDVPLEEALAFYKKGMELSKVCHDKLKVVEEALAKVVTTDGEEDFVIKEEE